MTANASKPVAIVAGHICLDLIPTFEQSDLSLNELFVPGKLIKIGPAVTSTGGTVSNAGLALHRLGIATGLMGKVGDDILGRAILELLRQHDEALAEEMIVAGGEQTSYTVVISPPGVDRMFLHCSGANDTYCAADLDVGKLAGAKLLHFGYPPLMARMYADGGAELAALLETVKDKGLTVSLDLARPDPASAAGRADWRAILAKALPHVDVFLPSIDEILFMLDRPRFEQMEASGDFFAQVDGKLLADVSDQLLAMGAAAVALKLGDRGLYMRTTNDTERLATTGECDLAELEGWLGCELYGPCFLADVVGTTGSGDCTVAGVLAGILMGLSAEQTLTAGLAVGACSVEAADATGGVPAWSEVQRRLAGGWDRLDLTVPMST
ncbi:MAG: carbohydrate kinase family protein [Planctomycetota bacterium]|jgi:sugar/nucleoside kinase (ribokinase family)